MSLLLILSLKISHALSGLSYLLTGLTYKHLSPPPAIFSTWLVPSSVCFQELVGDLESNASIVR